MQALRNTFDRAWAAAMFFTRLPLWRIHEPRPDAFRHVVGWWPLCGWLTGGTMAGVYALASLRFSPEVAMLMAIVARLLLTGALHEDGLADFADGMGGGRGRERTLEIMKDSHIGTYGVLAIVLHTGLLWLCLTELADCALCAAAVILTCDVWAKCCASMMVRQLPYARPQAEAKNRTVYVPWSAPAQAVRVAVAMLPSVALCWHADLWANPLVFALPMCVQMAIAWWLSRTLRGYTGDCCGASFLICELTALLTWLATS